MKKKIILFFAFVWLIISLLIIRSTYAKYLSSIDSNANFAIDGWKILLNNQDIIQNSDFSQTLNLIFSENDYYDPDYIVPSAMGYFDLVIDSSNISLAFKYTITVSGTSVNDISDVKVAGYSYPGLQENITYLTSDQTSIVGSSASSVNSSTIRVYVTWNDDHDTETLNDIEDTAIAISNGKAVIEANIVFEQLTA
ncbi:MAG: hypothetical protein IKG56_02705 [Clostridia bacterium]|nr:hypothetical protein [Clostridia bacterium]